MNQGALASQLDDWQLIPQPERYTELYFADHHQLPVMVKAGDTQGLPFTVYNREHQTVTYHYKITAGITEDTDGYLLGEGEITLAHNNSQTVRPTIVIPALSERLAVRVTLHYQDTAHGNHHPSLQALSVHHWVKAPSLGKGSS